MLFCERWLLHLESQVFWFWRCQNVFFLEFNLWPRAREGGDARLVGAFSSDFFPDPSGWRLSLCMRCVRHFLGNTSMLHGIFCKLYWLENLKLCSMLWIKLFKTLHCICLFLSSRSAMLNSVSEITGQFCHILKISLWKRFFFLHQVIGADRSVM